MKVLSDAKVGSSAEIACVQCSDPALRVRLMELGLVRGTRVEVLRKAPLGDPLIVRLRGYELSLRRIEAQAIEVSAEVSK